MNKNFEFHHVGIFTKDLDEALKIYTSMGYQAGSQISDKTQNVEIVLLTKSQSPLIEIVVANESTTWARGLAIGPYHTCYETDQFQTKLEEFEQRGFRLVLPPTKALAFNNRRVAFVWSSAVGLLELLEVV